MSYLLRKTVFPSNHLSTVFYNTSHLTIKQFQDAQNKQQTIVWCTARRWMSFILAAVVSREQQSCFYPNNKTGSNLLSILAGALLRSWAAESEVGGRQTSLSTLTPCRLFRWSECCYRCVGCIFFFFFFYEGSCSLGGGVIILKLEGLWFESQLLQSACQSVLRQVTEPHSTLNVFLDFTCKLLLEKSAH